MKKVLILMCICLLCFGCAKSNDEVEKNNNEPPVGDVNDLFDINIAT